MALSALDIQILQVAGITVLSILLLILYFRYISPSTLDTNSSSQQLTTVGVKRLWWATTKDKQWTEKFLVYYSIIWITIFAIVIVTTAWIYFGPWEYLYLGLLISVPCFVAPYFLEPQSIYSDYTSIPVWYQRYWFKANVWIFIFGFIGNYFWTHYFYSMLRAIYTLTAHRINNVPICMFLYTHAYFCTYHVITTILLRRWWTSLAYYKCPTWLRPLGSSMLIFVMSYVTAFMEAFTIQNFPYYAIEDREFMYTVGCIIYGLYFIVSFPMFYRLDEPIDEITTSTIKKDNNKLSIIIKSIPNNFTLQQTIFDSLAAGMLVTILLELWRLMYLGLRGLAPEGLLPNPPSNISIPPCTEHSSGLPWVN